MSHIRRALISVWDKSGLSEFASALVAMGVEMLATGGTARALSQAGLPVTTIEEITGFPEVLDGRVKTLHPAVFAAILARDEPQHRAQLEAHHIRPIDLVVVNLYPFDTQAQTASMRDAVELIDVGGVALLRAAAKNWERVAVVSDPIQYALVLEQLRQGGSVSEAFRRHLAGEAFARTAEYDAAIARYFGETPAQFPSRLILTYRKGFDTRYGENPHQRAAFYREVPVRPGSLADARQIQGKELSFNNMVDLDAALGLVREFDQPAAAIIKHAAPCGAAVAASIAEAYQAAVACDPVSAFGGVLALNRLVDDATAAAITNVFTEAVIAPGFAPGARAIFARRKNVRVLEVDPAASVSRMDVRSVDGGLLVQESDSVDLDDGRLTVVTPRAPTPQEMIDLRFAWKVAKWVKSNAIVLARNSATVGIGGGYPNRVGAVELAAKGAGERSRGAVLASDAFFPFRDGVDAAARAGVTAIIQPGGSVRDDEVIAAAVEHGVAMVLTGVRHFRH